MRKRWKRSLSKKLLCFSTAVMMMAVILMSSIPVKAASVREYIEFFNTGKIYRSVNTTLYQYNSITKTLTLKGGTINCYEMCCLESNVKGLRINVEWGYHHYGTGETYHCTHYGPYKALSSNFYRGL